MTDYTEKTNPQTQRIRRTSGNQKQRLWI